MALASFSPPFHAYDTSHWAVLLVTILGAVGMVVAGKHAPEPILRLGCRVLAALIFLLNLSVEVWEFRPTDAVHTLPLQLSDLAPYIAAIALWSRRRWAYCLTEYWCLTLSTQALLTPDLQGPDFPSLSFVVFFANHVLVVWAAIMLAWGLVLRPRWRDYWFAIAVTATWAAIMLAFNTIADTNYAFLNAKPSTPSLLDLLGPWPWYLLPESALVIAFWALLTWAWQLRPPTSYRPSSLPADPRG